MIGVELYSVDESWLGGVLSVMRGFMLYDRGLPPVTHNTTTHPPSTSNALDPPPPCVDVLSSKECVCVPVTVVLVPR